MRLVTRYAVLWLALIPLLTTCVDPEEIDLRGRVDIVVVDATITNLVEPQLIRLNRSRADPVTGRFGTRPITKAVVQVVEDSTRIVDCVETVEGTYRLPDAFRAQVGHAYQLRFILSDGTPYQSAQQVMEPVPPAGRSRAEFNPKSLLSNQLGGFTAGHDIFIDSQDPADQHNYYRWDWVLYERQYWCQTCQNGVYAVTKVIPHTYLNYYYFVAGSELYEDCFTPPPGTNDYNAPSVPGGEWYYDYRCRTQCWQILRNVSLNVFDDLYSNGGLIAKRKVGQIPFYQHSPCLVDIRQLSLTKDAYRYYKLVADQTQNTGGLADTPPTALAGNIYNKTNSRESVVGYFTASAVSVSHCWIDRTDAEGIPYGALDPSGPHDDVGDDLFYALNRRRPFPEPSPPYTGPRPEPKVRLWPNANRPPTALCVPSDSKTPAQPEGWRN